MKKPATLARRRSDYFVQKDKQRFDIKKSFKRSFYNVLAQNKDWPPLPAPSNISPACQGKKPVQLERRHCVHFQIDAKKYYFEEIKQLQRDEAKKEHKRVHKHKQEHNRKRQQTKERKQWR